VETSWPWDGTVDGDATLAPYDEQEWDDNERMMFGSGGNSGVLAAPYGLNNFKVTQRGAGANMSVDVDTGAALVYGKRYKSTATVNLAIAANASGNPRIDRVVAVWNRQAVAYAGVTPNINPKTGRVAVLQGVPAGAPAAPALTQTAATVYMIPLAQVYVANGAASITNANITDEREVAQASGGMMLIERRVLTAAAPSISFSTIRDSFRHLRIVGQARTAAVVTSGSLAIVFNGGAGSYDWVQSIENTGGVTTTKGLADVKILGPLVTGASGAANYADGFEIDIPGYRETTFYKSVLYRGTLADSMAAGAMGVVRGTGFWRSTAAITSVSITRFGGGNFDAGSVFSLYGLQ